MRRRQVLQGAAAAAAASLADGPAWAQKADDTLRIAWRTVIPDVDPYRNNMRAGLIASDEVWEMLVYRDPQTFKNVPALATEWKQPDSLTWEFTLRDGVKFHNGDPFGADDVVYTIETIIKDRMVSVPSNFSFWTGAEKINDRQVRLKLKSPFPAALEYLAMLTPIYPKTYREKVGASAYSRQPVGAGPYRITRINGSSEIDLERFDGYYADGPKGRPAIKNIRISQVVDANSELTAFIGGQADWIWQYNADQFNNLQMLPGKTALRAGSMRLFYLQLDAAGRTGKDNPLTKLPVRQAIFHAIDRQSIAHNLMQGDSHPVPTPCYPAQFGCDQSAAVIYDYDPGKARALLAEAGFKDGFSTTLVSNVLPAFNAAIQNQLQAVGIKIDLQQLQDAAVVQKIIGDQAPMNVGSWGSNSVNDVSAIMPYFLGGGGFDYARDPELQAEIAAGGSVEDPEERKKYYSAAIRRATEQAYWLPLFTSVTQYAFVKNLKFTPFPDELPRFYLCLWI
jgi:peptide/nickel transport system substrate-binding protein